MLHLKNINLICILGPTASGKTAFATNLAKILDGEIISADSRQVYRGMTIGTGKDLNEYMINGISIPYHLIDIIDAGSDYNVFRFQKDFIDTFDQITNSGKLPILCGGTGMYIESVLSGYKLINVPLNEELRNDLEKLPMETLGKILKSYRNLHNTTDTSIRKRIIRAIEIEDFYQRFPDKDENYPLLKPVIFGLNLDREIRRKRITDRLKYRLENGMIEEVKQLINSGISPEKLIFYGLEYKYITWFLMGKMTLVEMITQLNIAIHQFAKRQMTWFRKMEKDGKKIYWIDAEMIMREKLNYASKIIVENDFRHS